MDEGAWLDRLDATAESPADLFEPFEHRSADGVTYRALTDARHGVERGTVPVEPGGTDGPGDRGEAAIVRGYPSVPRVLVLEPGMASFFT